MIGLIIVAVLILIGVVVGSFYLHKGFLKGEYAKIAGYSSAVLLMALAIIVAIEMILAAVAIKKGTELVHAAKDRFHLTKGLGPNLGMMPPSVVNNLGNPGYSRPVSINI